MLLSVMHALPFTQRRGCSLRACSSVTMRVGFPLHASRRRCILMKQALPFKISRGDPLHESAHSRPHLPPRWREYHDLAQVRSADPVRSPHYVSAL